jgi:hypothetical protein
MAEEARGNTYSVYSPNEANPAPSGKELVGGLKRASEKVERLAERVHRRERYVEGAGLLG